jgi:nicotinate-nucleotide pyrophosphorylase (carboxylating)
MTTFSHTIDETVSMALREDVGNGDLTSALIPEASRSQARLITREEAVLCGVEWFNSVFRQLDERVAIQWQAADGDDIHPDQTLCLLEGPTRALLTGERTAMNFLQTLSGTATLTRQYAKVLAGTQAKLLDTRKTIPGLRQAQKYAVKCGGGHNHRMGLYDGILIKENHINAAGSITSAVVNAKKLYPDIRVEVEVETMAELEEALAAKADIVLLDNFTPEKLREAAARTQGRALLEASGGFDLATLRQAAESGVDYISVGSLTKHVRAIDLSMRFL